MTSPTSTRRGPVGRTTTWTQAHALRVGDVLAPHGDPAGTVTAVRDLPGRVEAVVDGVHVLRWSRHVPVQVVCDPAVTA